MSMIHRLKLLFDQSAWLLMLPASLLLYFTDPPMATTVAQWTLIALVLAGVAIIVSRVTFPQLDFDRLLPLVYEGNNAAAVVLAALVLCVGMIYMSLVLWARG